MPIYEFSCHSCGVRFEELVRSQDAAGVCCPACASVDVNRLLSAFSFSSSGGAGSAKNCAPCNKPSCAGCR
ncbi:MAG: zinc ribbon domain-containing protein [Actinobacteria bacterium]|nr:zinc ribbon domain-containing protein [Actinomycetota bacterium]